MNLQELIIELYEQLGEPSDFDPYDYTTDPPTFDITTEGAVKAIRYINNAYRTIAAWKFPNGDVLRLRELESEVFFKSAVVSGTAQGGSGDSITLEAGTSTVKNVFKGWVVKITGGLGEGQSKLITSFDEATQIAEVSSDWNTVPDATSEYELYKALYKFVPEDSEIAGYNIPVDSSEELIAVIDIQDIEGGRRIFPAERTQTFPNRVFSTGNPGVYVEENSGIKFNVAIDQVRTYAVHYSRIPEKLSQAEDEPVVPEQFQVAMLIWARWWYLVANQEGGASYAAKRDLDDFMMRMQDQFDRAYDKINGQLYIGRQ